MAKIVLLVGVYFLAVLVTPLNGQSTPLITSKTTDYETPALTDNLETTGITTPVGRPSSDRSSTINEIMMSTSTPSIITDLPQTKMADDETERTRHNEIPVDRPSSDRSSTINEIMMSTSTPPSKITDLPQTTAADDETARTRHSETNRAPASPNTTTHHRQPGPRTSTMSITYSEQSRNNENEVAISNISSVDSYDEDSPFGNVSKESNPSQSGQTNAVDEMTVVCYQETCFGGDCVTLFNDTTQVCHRSDQGSCSIIQKGNEYTADCKEDICSFESNNDMVMNCCKSSRCNNNINLLKGHGITLHLNMFLFIVATCLHLSHKY